MASRIRFSLARSTSVTRLMEPLWPTSILVPTRSRSRLPASFATRMAKLSIALFQHKDICVPRQRREQRIRTPEFLVRVSSLEFWVFSTDRRTDPTSELETRNGTSDQSHNVLGALSLTFQQLYEFYGYDFRPEAV